MEKHSTFEAFRRTVENNVDAFSKLADHYKYYFYHLFMNKITGKNKGKDDSKKERKLKKIRKRFFKLMRGFRNDIN